MPPRLDGAALAGWAPGAPLARLAGATMGTGWRVLLARPARIDLAALERAIVALLAGLVAQMSHWEAGSELGRFNRAPAGAVLALADDFAAVIGAALDVARASDGAFDPAIGALVDLWGFGPEAPPAAPPDASAVAAACAVGGWRRLAFDPGAGTLRQPGGLRLDLSGIAKGYAVDRVAALLGAHGVRHALVEVGGELAGRGLRPDGDPWWVELETPPPAAVPPIRVALHELAVATSGDTVRGCHTLDPRTGGPVAHVLAISVVHERAMLADAWATALGVLPRDAMAALAETHALAVRALLRDGGRIDEWISPALAAMLAD